MSTNDRDSRSKTDIDKARKKAEQTVRELQVKIDDERKVRVNYEEMANRHERKANSLMAEVEKLEKQLDTSDRDRRQLEKRISEL